jgi:hypothetical protein
LPQNLKAVLPRYAEIEQDRVEPLASGDCEGRIPVRRLNSAMAEIA